MGMTDALITVKNPADPEKKYSGLKVQSISARLANQTSQG